MKAKIVELRTGEDPLPAVNVAERFDVTPRTVFLIMQEHRKQILALDQRRNGRSRG